jgi:hypothetical protein
MKPPAAKNKSVKYNSGGKHGWLNQIRQIRRCKPQNRNEQESKAVREVRNVLWMDDKVVPGAFQMNVSCFKPMSTGTRLRMMCPGDPFRQRPG